MGKTKKRALMVILGLPALLLAISLVVGSLLPEHHRATSTARYQEPPDTVWATITGFEQIPTWRPEIKEMKRLPDGENGPVWVEVSNTGEIPYEVVEQHPPYRMLTRIADPDMPFGGTWTYEITAVEGGSALKLTEDGEIYNALYRFMARFVFGHHSTMDSYLTRLGQKFGEETKPEHRD